MGGLNISEAGHRTESATTNWRPLSRAAQRSSQRFAHLRVFGLAFEVLSLGLDNSRTGFNESFLRCSYLKYQIETNVDREARGPSWISRVTLPASTNFYVCQLVLDAVKFLNDGNEPFETSVLSDVHAQ